MIKVSVIVTVYNQKEYLKKCLDSVAAQTLQEIEVIIVDNASTDNPQEQIGPYLSDPRFRLVHLREECGPGGARNAGLDRAGGEYVAFLDGDDWVDLGFYQTLHEAASKANADVAVAGQIVEHDAPRRLPNYKFRYDREYELSGETALRIMSGEYVCEIRFPPSPLCKVFRASYLKNNGLRFAPGVFYEDQAFSYATLLACNKAVCVPGIAYHYFKREGSITQSFTDRHIDDMKAAYLSIRGLLEERGLFEKYKASYYLSLEHYYGLVVRQIFENSRTEEQRKEYLRKSFRMLKDTFLPDEYFEVCSSEKIRRHIQPGVTSTAVN